VFSTTTACVSGRAITQPHIIKTCRENVFSLTNACVWVEKRRFNAETALCKVYEEGLK
jgi:hypothetical protein